MNWFTKILVLSLLIGFSNQLATADEAEIKTVKDLNSVVKKYFANLEGYRSGDLITTGDVGPLLQLLKKKGWSVPQRSTLTSRLTKTGSFLDKTLSSKNGENFLGEVSKVPGGADRIERIAKLKNGKGTLNQLLKFPHGSDLIKELATTKVGRNLGRYAAKREDGKDFNKPTGKIYTESELVKELVKRFKEDPKRQE